MLQNLHRYFSRFFKTPRAVQATKKPAIALITYCRFDYFEQVYASLKLQQIDGRPFTDFFDLYVFQDGLFASESNENKLGHQRIMEFCQKTLNPENYCVQSNNLGVALHFDRIERMLFEQENRPWIAFCEDDLVLSPGYLETLRCMAQSFEHDDRVGMFSCFSKSSQLPIEEQAKQPHKITDMQHHWAFGMHKRAWTKRQPFVNEYLKLVKDAPYRERPNGRIQNWHAFCGFKPGATSQDYAKACAMAALGMVKISSFANFAAYIGKQGLHFTPEIFSKHGFDTAYIYPSPITQPFHLDPTTYNEILKKQRALIVEDPLNFDQANFLSRLEAGSFAPTLSDQWIKNVVSEADVISAYKLFLDRLPESRQVVQSRIGIPPDRLFIAFITSAEFRARKEFHPIILALAKEILQTNQTKTQSTN